MNVAVPRESDLRGDLVRQPRGRPRVECDADAGRRQRHTAAAEPRADRTSGAFQTDAEYRIGRFWRVVGRLSVQPGQSHGGGDANAALVGKYLPQVPKNRGSFQVAYSNPQIHQRRVRACSSIGTQFDDDQNVGRPGGARGAGIPSHGLAAGYGVRGHHASRTRWPATSTCSSACRTCSIRNTSCGTLPTTIGSPRLVNGGVRIRFDGDSSPLPS